MTSIGSYFFEVEGGSAEHYIDVMSKDALVKVAAAFLKSECNPEQHAIIGYQLSKTLSANGTVSRGVCEVDSNNNLVSIAERTKIYAEGDGIVCEDAEGKYSVSADSSVSMNFWCFDDSVFYLTSKMFKKFLNEHGQNEKSEFFLPIVADEFIKEELGVIKVIPTSSQWFGVTYKEDTPGVQQSINDLLAAAEYPQSLWN
jgi:hypothetical protein